VLRAHADHPFGVRHQRLCRRTRPDRGEAARRHGRQVDLRHRKRRQEPARHHRDADRLRTAVRHRAALPARHRRHRRFTRAAHRRGARAVRARTHPVTHRQPRQPGGRSEGSRTPA